ncbi:MAG: hypothetical protein JWO82_364 [Akkermansiaceae bacterium]|nr:hypothetical protein [Akkermansiaceae bacterium]
MASRRKSLGWYLTSPQSDFRQAKCEASERFLGVSRRGKKILHSKAAPGIYTNLVGVGRGEKFTGRKPQGKPAITFYVKKKLPLSQLDRRLVLPRTIAGLPCDVIACGTIHCAAGPVLFNRLDPLIPGAQIQVAGGAPGTLGGFVRDRDGDVCLITNCHVLSPDLRLGVGEPVYQPSIAFRDYRQIATVKAIVPVSTSNKNRVDVALARLEDGIAYDPVIPGFLPFEGTGAPEFEDYDDGGWPEARVSKYGQATDLKQALLHSADADVPVDYDHRVAIFTGVYIALGASFAAKGDSGSAVYNTGNRKVVGLLTGVSGIASVISPSSAIESSLPGLLWLTQPGLAPY